MMDVVGREAVLAAVVVPHERGVERPRRTGSSV